jgi:metal-responsive CopG/Arc/MetJ family transcriptional regulator
MLVSKIPSGHKYKVSRTVIFCLTVEDYDNLNKLAAKRAVSRSELVRDIVHDTLSGNGHKK